MSDTHIHQAGKFFGCYLLCSTNPKYKGRTYIGFTVNPNRRIQQHNAGYNKGGAKRTSGRGPWEMVLIIHGFPNEISALRFEWAWQNPEKSLRLKHLVPKNPQYNFIAKFNVVAEMLRVGPWSRLPLTVRWLKQEYKRDFPLNKQPPNHMPFEYGLVQLITQKKTKKKLDDKSSLEIKLKDICYICKSIIDRSDVLSKNLLGLKCLKCNVIFHTICLANCFINSDDNAADGSLSLIPIDGNCPKCEALLMWGDLIKYRLGSYKTNDPSDGGDEVDEETDGEDDDDEDFVERDDDMGDEDENENNGNDYF